MTNDAASSATPGPGHRYGRGKFEAHSDYVGYMRMIVEHPNYAGMPGAVSKSGRINWQVSSGKTTSFYEYYLARAKWWEAKADALGLPGHGKENDRFSLAARVIHPTGYRPCRLCGELRNVGYFYLNAVLAKRLTKLTGAPDFYKGQPIAEAVQALGTLLGGSGNADAVVRDLFPERANYFDKLGVSPRAFEESNHMRSRWLSPGYMANPPDRLDGFHDYCISCRATNDPGRSEENLRSYQHDRRAFEWWAEGDWALADALYNSAGPGECSICGIAVDRVSPDHVGPLACGFKQLPLFMPTCQPCNSSKNRRMSASDVRLLLAYEDAENESAASWHVRGIWDAYKGQVQTDAEAGELSAHMRAVQDCYLRCLFALLNAGEARFLSSLLHPEYAYFDHVFVDLDRATLQFRSVATTENKTPYRESLANRSVRIAFEELALYVEKEATRRRIRTGYDHACGGLIERVLSHAATLPVSPLDGEWNDLLRTATDRDQLEAGIGELRGRSDDDTNEKDSSLRQFMQGELDQLASAGGLELG